jgi:hypothetical protein
MKIIYNEEREELVDESECGLELDILCRLFIESLRKSEHKIWEELVFEKGHTEEPGYVPDSDLMKKRLGNVIYNTMFELVRIGDKIYNKS